jgi:hypothetical protein
MCRFLVSKLIMREKVLTCTKRKEKVLTYTERRSSMAMTPITSMKIKYRHGFITKLKG